jgi:histidinol-phosphate aminotransferase
MRGLRVDLTDIGKKINKRTKVIFLCNPNNPTGDVLPPQEVKVFLDSVPEHVLVVLDEAYTDFTEPQAKFDSVGMFKGGMSNLFILRSFSKIYGLAGLRFGYGIGNEELASLINLIKPPFDVSILAEQAALEAISDQAFVRRTVEGCAVEKRYFYEQLDALDMKYVRSHTNFILIDTGRDAQDLFQALLQQGVIVRAATLYSLPTCIRVTVGLHEENEKFFEALRAVL